MTNALDILKIQKTIRKSIKDHQIVAKHTEEALVSLVSVELYLALTAEEVTPPAPKPKVQKTESLKTPKLEPAHV